MTITNIIVWTLLSLLWFFGRRYCCCVYDGNLEKNISAIISFSCIAFSLNTSIAIKWVRSHFSSYIHGITRMIAVKYMAISGPDKKRSDEGADIANRFEEIFIRFFDDNMRLASQIYPIVGLVFAVAIVCVLYTGIPQSSSAWIILLPFPALAYYLTAVLSLLIISVMLYANLRIGIIPIADKVENARSDVDEIWDMSRHPSTLPSQTNEAGRTKKFQLSR